MTFIVAISAAVALLAGMLPWPDRLSAPLAIVLAALAGPLTALLVSDVRIVPAAVLAIVVASIIAAFRRLRTLTLPLIASPALNVADVVSEGSGEGALEGASDAVASASDTAVTGAALAPKSARLQAAGPQARRPGQSARQLLRWPPSCPSAPLCTSWRKFSCLKRLTRASEGPIADPRARQ
ncbi:hypothetical protein NHF46_18680 [Arthrobacter alpinus]|nr:hypothetical protein [Arthrobacter alpinus]